MTVEIYLGDCLKILPTINLAQIDAIITDPPYGLSYDSSHAKYKNGISRPAVDWDDDPFDPTPILALAKPTILWGANCYSACLPNFPGWLCWVKTARNGAEVRQAEMELAWTNCIRRPQVYRHLWIGAYRDSENGVRNVHPTQKPIEVMQWCIRIATEPGATILDPYMGSGTTGVACIKSGRNFVGIEIKEGYFDGAKRRLEEAQWQLPLLPLE